MIRAALFLALTPLAAAAQSHDPAQHGHSGHDMAMHETTSPSAPPALPTQPGQDAFGAIAEIVEILRSDPDTNWGKVDLPALRAHLKDMDTLFHDVTAQEVIIEGGLKMVIDRNSSGADAAVAMVPAHGPVLSQETGWNSAVITTDTTITWQVTSPDDAAQIQALGFLGLMATGNHHPEHHLAIARGDSAHIHGAH